MTLVCHIENGAVKYVEEGPKTKILEDFPKTPSSEQKVGIRAVVLDMGEPFF